jgi:DNA-binding transcriptional MerR regulator
VIKIGTFSKLSRVPIKTLRYYDEIDLLHPAEVDPVNGYRYYEVSQIPRLSRILALKELGFSLEQIGRMLDDHLTVDQVRGMLRLKYAEAEQDIQAAQQRLTQIESRLRQLDQEITMPTYEIILKEIPAFQGVGIREVLPTFNEYGRLIGDLFQSLGRLGIQPMSPPVAIYHDPELKDSDHDVEVLTAVQGAAIPAGEKVFLREVPAVEKMVTLMYVGPYDNFSSPYQAISEWIETNGYTVAGPNREIYLKGPGETTDPNEFITEIQFPVVKN